MLKGSNKLMLHNRIIDDQILGDDEALIE